MAQIYHFDLYGRREDKYKFLQANDVYTVEWTEISPQSPFYLFCPQNRDLLSEYNEGWKITEIMPVNSVGVVTGQDNETVAFSYQDTEILCQRHGLPVSSIFPILYRPFDERLIVYDSKVVTRPRTEVMRHMLAAKDNLALITVRKAPPSSLCNYFMATHNIIINGAIRSDNQSIDTLFPLYLYPDTENEQGNLLSDAYCGLHQRTPNLSQKFLSVIREKLNYIPTPEAIFYYAYAIFHSPTYRQRYAEFLKIDFPRLPLTSNNDLFQALSKKGEELVELHLMKSKKLNKIITKYPVSGDNAVTEVTYNQDEQRTYINKQQYFEGIAPEVWMFKIGGYQVLDKWLKDRKKAKRSLSFDDVLHYQRVIVALKETMQIMTELDQLIPSFPIE